MYTVVSKVYRDGYEEYKSCIKIYIAVYNVYIAVFKLYARGIYVNIKCL